MNYIIKDTSFRNVLQNGTFAEGEAAILMEADRAVDEVCAEAWVLGPIV